jgi:hypothetical protein
MANVDVIKATYDVRRAILPERSGEATEGKPWASRDGAIVEMDWRQALAIEGRVFCFNLGNVTTSVAGKEADIEQPQIAIRNPTSSGVAMIPLEAHIYCEDTVDATTELIVACASIDMGNGTSSAGNAYVQNMKSGKGGSAVTVRYTYSGAGTAAEWGTNYWELQRTGALYNIAEDTMLEPELHYMPEVSPILVPPSTFYLFWGGTSTTTAYATAIWAEVPLGSITV